MRYPIELIQVRAILRRYLAENPRPDCHREGVSLALDALKDIEIECQDREALDQIAGIDLDAI